jgi:hypothetical protein
MARGRYNEQEPDLYEDQFGQFYYDPNTGEFVSVPAVSGIGAPEVAYVAPQSEQTYYEPEQTYYGPQRESEQTYYEPEQYYAPPPPPAPEQYYAPTPALAPEPAPEPAPVSGIGSPVATSYEPEQTYTQATVEQYAEPAPVSGIGAPEVSYVAPQPEPAQSSTPAMTPEFLQQIQQGAASVGNAAESGGISALFAPGTLSPLDPLYDYAKTAPILSLKGDKEYENLNFQALPDTNYQLTVGGNVVGTASNPQEVATLVDQANAISEQGGKAVDVRLQKEVQAATPTGEPITAFEDVYANQKNNNGFLDIALPAALAAISGGTLGPLLGGGFLGTGAAAGLGSVAGSLGTGDSLKNALIKGALTGITAGAFSGLGAAAPAASSATGAGAAGAGAGAAGAAGASAFAPVAGEILVQTTRPLLSAALSSGLGAGIGSIGSSLVQPDPFKQALDQARVENQYASTPVEADEILALGQRAAPTIPGTEALAPITGGALTAPLSPQDLPAQPAQPAQPPGEPEIVVTNIAPPKVDLAGLSSPAVVEAFDQFLSDNAGMVGDGTAEAPADEDIDVTGKRIGKVTLPPASLPAAVVSDVITKYKPPEPVESLIEKQAKKIDDADPITVTAKPIPAPPGFSAALPGLAMTLPAMTAAQAISTTAATPPDKKGLTPLQKASAGLTLASALADAVGGDGGGGGPLDLGTGYTVPGTGSGIGRTRNVATFDPFTYGQKEGEFRFFNTGPAPAPAPSRFSAEPIMQSTGGLLGALNNPIMLQNLQEAMAAEPAFNAAASTGMAEGGEVDDDMVSHLIAYRKGGGHMGPGKVKGIGSGQDDKIPAWLSDGEYVWSAQDVADLGDGSTDEGVRRLDKMRQMVRKGAGRKDVKKIAKPQRGIEDMLKAVGGAV